MSHKLVLLGDASVGKSCLVVRFARNEFHEHQEPTIGAAFLTQRVRIDDTREIKFEIWDTAGQERYRSLAPMYYRGAAAAACVFDVNNPSSLEGAKSWVSELKAVVPNCVIALIGNKIDLVPDYNRDEIINYAEEEGILCGFTSALSGDGVWDIFENIAKELPISDSSANNTNVINISPNTQTRTGALSSKCGCS